MNNSNKEKESNAKENKSTEYPEYTRSCVYVHSVRVIVWMGFNMVTILNFFFLFYFAVVVVVEMFEYLPMFRLNRNACILFMMQRQRLHLSLFLFVHLLVDMDFECVYGIRYTGTALALIYVYSLAAEQQIQTKFSIFSSLFFYVS